MTNKPRLTKAQRELLAEIHYGQVFGHYDDPERYRAERRRYRGGKRYYVSLRYSTIKPLIAAGIVALYFTDDPYWGRVRLTAAGKAVVEGGVK